MHGCGHTTHDLPDLPAEYRVVDLLDRPAVEEWVAAVRPHHVVHLAALSSPARSWQDPAGTITTNIAAQVHLLEAIRGQDQLERILVVTSGEVYGAAAPAHLPTSEDAPLLPRNPYAVSKVAQDASAWQYHAAWGLPIVRARPFNHIGPGQSDAFVAAAFARQVAEAEAGQGPAVIRVGNLDAARDFSDVRDVVAAYRLLLDRGEPGAAYNIGSGVARPVRAVLDGLLALARVPLAVETDPARLQPSDVPVMQCDATRLRQATGWAPAWRFEDTLAAVLDDWRQRVAARAATPGRRTP